MSDIPGGLPQDAQYAGRLVEKGGVVNMPGQTSAYRVRVARPPDAIRSDLAERIQSARRRIVERIGSNALAV